MVINYTQGEQAYLEKEKRNSILCTFYSFKELAPLPLVKIYESSKKKKREEKKRRVKLAQLQMMFRSLADKKDREEREGGCSLAGSVAHGITGHDPSRYTGGIIRNEAASGGFSIRFH